MKDSATKEIGMELAEHYRPIAVMIRERVQMYARLGWVQTDISVAHISQLSLKGCVKALKWSVDQLSLEVCGTSEIRSADSPQFRSTNPL